MGKKETAIPQKTATRRQLAPKPKPPSYPQPLRKSRQFLTEQHLKDEIEMLRITLRRFFELAKGCDDLDTMASTLNVIGLGAIRVSRLLLAERQLGGGHDPLMEAIQNIVAETAREMTTLVNDL